MEWCIVSFVQADGRDCLQWRVLRACKCGLQCHSFYRCRPCHCRRIQGYHGSGVAVCQADGTFSTPKCEATECEPSQVPNSDKEAAGSIKGKAGEKVYVTCKPQFAGRGWTVCQPNGKFSPVMCSEVPHYSPVGCYKDSTDRTMELYSKNMVFQSVDECAAVAYGAGYRNFALQAPGQCFVSNSQVPPPQG